MKKIDSISNIYWHFTGSPTNVDWNLITSPKQINKKPKSDNKAYEILEKIIMSKKLIASATEIISEGIETEKFCCITDIPLKDLVYHSKTYGNIAIGFSAKSIQYYFNPVLYLPNRKLPYKTGEPNIKVKFSFKENQELELLFSNLGLNKNKIGIYEIPGIVNPSIDSNALPRFLINYFKISDFSEKIGESFYPEREWRKIGDFNFKIEDIESIIIPRKMLNKFYYFVNQYNLNIPVITWDIINKT